MKKLIIKSVGTYLNTLATISSSQAGKVGYKLFSTPMKAPMKSHHLDFLKPAKSMKIPYEDIEIQTYKWGTGPLKILFVHGWESHTFRWKKYIQAFPMDQYTLIGMDAPAHGLSGGRQVNAITYAEAIRQVIEEYGSFEAIVGHSFGGFAAMYALYEDNTLPVKGLVMMGVPGRADDFFKEGKRQLGLKTKADMAIRNHFVKLFDDDIKHFTTLRFGQVLDRPGLIIHDVNDREAPYTHAVALEKVWKDAQLITTKGLGHKLYSDQIVQNILSFIQGLSAEKSRASKYPSHI